MIFIRKLLAIALLILMNNAALAANIDFKTINNNASKNCADNDANENCTNVNELNSVCQTKNSNEASKHEICANEKIESYVEPKFSTKRPRGQ